MTLKIRYPLSARSGGRINHTDERHFRERALIWDNVSCRRATAAARSLFVASGRSWASPEAAGGGAQQVRVGLGLGLGDDDDDMDDDGRLMTLGGCCAACVVL